MCHGLIQGEPSGKITAGNLGPYWKERRKRSFLMSTLKHLPKRKGSTLGSFWMKLLRWESLSFISGIFIYSLIVQYTDIVFGVLVRPIFEFLGFMTFSSDFPPFKTCYYVTCQEWMSSFCSFQMYSCFSGTEMPLAVHYQWALRLSFCLQCGAIAPYLAVCILCYPGFVPVYLLFLVMVSSEVMMFAHVNTGFAGDCLRPPWKYGHENNSCVKPAKRNCIKAAPCP